MADFEKNNYYEIAKEYTEEVLNGNIEVPQPFVDKWLEENFTGND